MFVVLAGSSTNTTSNVILSSPDGITWTQRTLPATAGWHRVFFGNGMFLAVGGSGTGAKSSDGITWTTVTTIPTFASRWLYMSFGSGLFILSYLITNSFTRFYTSSDGATWTPTADMSGQITAVAYGNGLYVGLDTISAQSYTSTDGLTWTAHAISASAAWSDIAFGNGLFIAVADGVAATSSDGINWTQATLTISLGISQIEFLGGLFMIVGKGAVSLESVDGLTWKQRLLPALLGTGNSYSCLTGGMGIFVAIQNSTTVAATTPAS
jgi:hypothetical protein